MNEKYEIKNIKLKLNFFLLMCIITSTFFLSIGYAGVNPITLDIKGTVSASAQDGVFIRNIDLVGSKNIVEENIINIYKTMLQTKIVLSADTTESYAKYEIEVYNSTTDNYCFTGANYDGLYTNNDIGFELEGIQEGDLLGPGQYKNFYITFKYNTNIVPNQNMLESYIDFVFKKVYKVTYENITNNNYPNYAIVGENFTVSFTPLNAPIEVKVGGKILSSSNYTYNNNTLTISNPNADIHIRKLTKYTIKNIVSNGSFENGLNDWTIIGGSSSATWRKTNISHFGSTAYYRDASAYGVNYLRQTLSFKTGHKYYFFAYSICTSKQDFFADIAYRNSNITFKSVPNKYGRGSVIYTADFTGTNYIHINFARTTDSVIVDGIGMVDLTEAFGAGNEPNKTWCDSNIAYFDSSTTVYK